MKIKPLVILAASISLSLGATAFASCDEQAATDSTKSSSSATQVKASAPGAVSTVLTVQQMTCSSCAKKIEAKLRGVPGVKTVSSKPELKQIEVTSDRTLASDVLIKAVKAAGYDATI